ncbi:MAG: allophanate hydrolase, partial [Gammaproteobacteria bacterium]
MVSFALGTDTAGSGRVPASFNNLVGFKPTRGLLSARGVVPACRTLDCVSIFALNTSDAAQVFRVAMGFDGEDPFSRAMPNARPRLAHAQHVRIGVPRAEDLVFFNDRESEELFNSSISALEVIGARIERVDMTPFYETARLLYEGPWVAERYAAIRSFIERKPAAMHPVVRAIIEPAIKRTAVDTFEAQYRLAALKRQADNVLSGIDALLTPTTPTIYTIQQLLTDPISLNSNLGVYTNFVNLLDLSAVTVPTGFRRNGLPHGVTLCALAFHDHALLDLAQRLQSSLHLPLGTARTPYRDISLPEIAYDDVAVVVCGAHMSGLPLNSQLIELGATLACRTQTAPRYRLHALTAFNPERPGLIRDEIHGVAIDVEVWNLPACQLGAFFRRIPAPLTLGRVELEDGRRECGFLCEAYALNDAVDISKFGGWRGYLAALH